MTTNHAGVIGSIFTLLHIHLIIHQKINANINCAKVHIINIVPIIEAVLDNAVRSFEVLSNNITRIMLIIIPTKLIHKDTCSIENLQKSCEIRL